MRSSAASGVKEDCGGRMRARSTGSGIPFSSRKETRASPTPSSAIASATLMLGLLRKVSAAALTAFWSRGVKARRACCTRLPSWPRMVSGKSSGFWVTKYTPTPLERIRRTTCSICSTNALAALSNIKCASSKNITNFGLSKSPTSGRVSNNSASIHSKNALYIRGERISFSELRMLMMPLPLSVCIQSCRLREGSPKNFSAPSFSKVSSWR